MKKEIDLERSQSRREAAACDFKFLLYKPLTAPAMGLVIRQGLGKHEKRSDVMATRKGKNVAGMEFVSKRNRYPLPNAEAMSKMY